MARGLVKQYTSILEHAAELHAEMADLLRLAHATGHWETIEAIADRLDDWAQRDREIASHE